MTFVHAEMPSSEQFQLMQFNTNSGPVVCVRQTSVRIVDKIGERGLRCLDYTHVPQTRCHPDISPASERHL